jgi:hypothetical protein
MKHWKSDLFHLYVPESVTRAAVKMHHGFEKHASTQRGDIFSALFGLISNSKTTVSIYSDDVALDFRRREGIS